MRIFKTLTSKVIFSGIALSLVLLLLVYPFEQSIDSLINEIYALPPSTTIQCLERQGYLNLTDIQPDRVSEISEFLHSEGLFRPTILKTVTIGTEGPVIRVFSRPKDASILYMITYDVASQVVYTLNDTYYRYTDEVCKENSVTEVWLQPHGDYKPHLLYRYYSQ